MLLECELCGANYKADIADAHVQGGRLTFTCRSCGKEVVVVGGPEDRSRRAGVLLPDQGDELLEAPRPPAGEFAGAPLGAAGAEPAIAGAADGHDVFAEASTAPEILGAQDLEDAPVIPQEAAAAVAPLPVPAPAETQPAKAPVADVPREAKPAPAPGPEGRGRGSEREEPVPFLAAPEKKGPSPVVLAVGGLVVVAAAFVFFVRPMLSGKPEAPAAPVTPAAATPAPAAAPDAAPTQPPAVATVPPTAVPVPERAPAVQIKELAKPPEARPTPVPAARKEPAAREAATVMDPGAIQEAFIRVRPLYRLCAVAELKRDPAAKPGTVTATLTILPTGAVSRAVLDRPDLASSPLGQCVRDGLSKMTFPPFEGAPVVLRQAIDLDVTTSK